MGRTEAIDPETTMTTIDASMHDELDNIEALGAAARPTRAPKATRRGFPGLCCIKCGCEDAVRVGLEDLGFSCGSCDEEFTAADVRAVMAGWARVLEWLEAAPAAE